MFYTHIILLLFTGSQHNFGKLHFLGGKLHLEFKFRKYVPIFLGLIVKNTEGWSISD